MKKFIDPEMVIQNFEIEDIIATSGDLSGETPED